MGRKRKKKKRGLFIDPSLVISCKMSRVIHDYMYLVNVLKSPLIGIYTIYNKKNHFAKYDEESIDECSCW